MDFVKIAKDARKAVLGMIYRGQTSHIGSNFSVIDIASVLYELVDLNKDRIVWSKGWAAATIYYFLAQKGIIPKEDLDKFPSEPYFGLAETSVRGVEVSGGAMGHGLPVAVGLALGKKRSNEEGKVYCIMSDGEMQEGTTWESALIAAHNKLDNLVVIIDYNKWCAMGRTNEVSNLEPFHLKWEAFNWRTLIVDGHNYVEIESALNAYQVSPKVIIANTIKGKGVSFFEDALLYHYKQVSEEEYQKAMEELNA